MHLVRGTHETGYREYPRLHSSCRLAVVPRSGAPARRILERTMTDEGWPAFEVELGRSGRRVRLVLEMDGARRLTAVRLR